MIGPPRCTSIAYCCSHLLAGYVVTFGGNTWSGVAMEPGTVKAEGGEASAQQS